jgi:TrmH family RNA methyltransferase
VRQGSLIPRYGRARRDPALAVLEGLHPLKHALRFGASVLDVRTRDEAELGALLAELAPDVRERALELAQEVPPDVFERLVPLAPATGVVALAERALTDPAAIVAGTGGSPVILLEDPRDLGNLGACVRVAAGADAGGVVTLGGHDPWHPDALRGAAGLHFALPVARAEALPALAPLERPLLALDPEGAELDPEALPDGAVLVFGSERRGLSDELLARADARLRIPMRAGVSSLNLATSVAAVLFAWRLAPRAQHGSHAAG